MTGRPTLRVVLAMLICLAVAEWLSFTLAVWMLALLSFAGLREYLSLADLRPEDRWAMLAAYLGIPLQFYLVTIDWYGFFIVCIPVYLFVVVPYLVALGGRGVRGSVFSVGAIDFGLFLFVYCIGHLAYMARYSTALALFIVLGVGVTDLIARWVARAGGGPLLSYLGSVPPVFMLASILARGAGVPLVHAMGITLLLPLLVLMGNFTLRAVEEDLGIDPAQLEPGRGLWTGGLRAQLFAAPVVFHYLRYFTEIY